MNINDWKQDGRVSIWRYEGDLRNYPGWQLNCDEAGAASLVCLIKVLAQSTESSERTVSVTRPAQRQLSVPNCSAKSRSPDKLILKVSPEWCISELEGKVILCFPREMASEIENGLQALLEGGGDYCIGEKGSKLWFWW